MPSNPNPRQGNFQPNRDEVDRIWKERAQYGHFFYRIPNGESGADCADRCSSFNDSLWRRFNEPDMASVAIIVSHGMVIRCFLMRWYHFSVEYFEDLRNINHVEFIVMRLKENNGRYALQNQLRTWSDLKKERAARSSVSAPSGEQSTSPLIPPRRTWGCPEGCRELSHGHERSTYHRAPVRRNTADLFKDDNELTSTTPRPMSGSSIAHRDFAIPEEDAVETDDTSSAKSEADRSGEQFSLSQAPEDLISLAETYDYRGRDGGGSMSGAPSPLEGSDEDEPYTDVPPGRRDNSDTAHFHNNPFRGGSLGRALRGELESFPVAMADALGDQSDAEVEEDDAKMGDKQRQKDEENRILEDERRDRGRSTGVS